MITQNLAGIWRCRNTTHTEWMDATIPGTIYQSLLENGKMEDPYYRDNEIRANDLMEEDYELEYSFHVEEDLLCQDSISLIFYGIDTIVSIYLNNTLLGFANNMHRPWTYQVKELLKKQDNVLSLVFRSPNQYAREQFAIRPTLGSEDTIDGFVHVRKAHYMYGWDWGAHLPDMGVFRKVELTGYSTGRILNTHVRQQHSPHCVRLTLDHELESQVPHYTTLTILDDQDTVLVQDLPSNEYEIKEPHLWWPNGLGEQPLYTVLVKLYENDKKVHEHTVKIGLRTLSVKREKDAYGECFEQQVNGLSYFAMGANYIPEDHLLYRTNRDRTYTLLKDCKDANFNSIRVWGGGYYPEDWFYEICDELGLVVWQDFMFACAVYDLTEEFEASITEEFIYNIKRLRNHASLGLWCGNNEMEQFVGANHHWVSKQSEVRDYIIMYERILPKLLEQLDPDTFYWPASPSSGGSFDEPNDPTRGDVHYWEVWHQNRPFSEYRKYFFRYASEFGFQSFPLMKTCTLITDREEELNPFSYIMEKHQRNYGANGKIMNYMQQTFLYPTSFETFIFASQLLQAEAIKYGIEHFRRNREQCMGAIYWQLNDCWPVISWASIDYGNRWKALHYYAKRFFAPIMISCQEENMMTAEADMNRQHFDFEKSIRLNVANERKEALSGKVYYELRKNTSEIIETFEEDVYVEPMSVTWLKKVLFDHACMFDDYVSYRLEVSEEIISSGSVIFTYPKYFHYVDPQLTCTVEGDTLLITSHAYAKSVEILNENQDLVLEDNYLDMDKGERRLQVLRGDTSHLTIRSVYDIR
ncbi:MAG: glycoside hydrolase family 2 protein [Eubacteriales bacterium]